MNSFGLGGLYSAFQQVDHNTLFQGINFCRPAATEAIFTSEKVQDIVPISKDSVLILGQGMR